MLLSLLLGLVGIALMLATLPLLAELFILTLAALLPAPKIPEETATSQFPPIAVLVPAHNEESLIGRCVRSVRASADAGLEILVVAHNCTDTTAAEAEAAGARVLLLNDDSRKGKGCALSYGFGVALAGPAQAILVVDADSLVDPGLIAAVRGKFLTGARALQCRYEVYNSHDSRRTKLMTLAFYAFNVIRPRGRARLGLSAGILGNGFALHRDVLTQIPYGAHSIVEDLEYHLALVRAGIRVEFINAAAVRGEMPLTAKSAQTQRARWEGGRMLMMKQWVPGLMADVSRGRLRLIEPLLDLLALPIATEVTLLLVAACLPITWLRLYVLCTFSVLFIHVMIAAILGSGFWKAMEALSTVPAYILWKLWILPEIWRASKSNAAWARTKRESPADSR